MRLVSFDVGINHLAFCVLKKSKKTGEIKIEDFELLSIFDENKKIKCCGTTGKGTACTKMSKMMRGGDYFCGTHAPDDAGEIKRVNTKTASFSTIAEKFKLAMENYDFSIIDKVVIENQPSMASKRMQFTSHILFYYMATNYPNAKVSYAPRDKWKVYDGPEIKIENSRKAKTRAKKTDPTEVAQAKTSLRNKEYKSRKAAGIQMAEYLLKKHGEDEWLEFFNSATVDKKDDLSDCYLQGLTALMK
jgi:hypothetical protein